MVDHSGSGTLASACLYAPSSELRTKVRDALLCTLHHSSLYRRLIIANKEIGAHTKTVGHALRKKLTYSPWEGTSALKSIYGQLYNGILTKRYGHAPTCECSLYHLLDSCTHIAGEWPDHEALRISRHNVARQLVHAAIRKTAKGRRALHSAPGLVLGITDTGTQPMTMGDSIELLSPNSEGTNLSPTTETPPTRLVRTSVHVGGCPP